MDWKRFIHIICTFMGSSWSLRIKKLKWNKANQIDQRSLFILFCEYFVNYITIQHYLYISEAYLKISAIRSKKCRQSLQGVPKSGILLIGKPYQSNEIIKFNKIFWNVVSKYVRVTPRGILKLILNLKLKSLTDL